MTQPRPLLPAETIILGILLERLGGRVVIEAAEMALFDRDGQLVQWHDPVTGSVTFELRRPPVTVAGEVVDEVRAIAAREVVR